MSLSHPTILRNKLQKFSFAATLLALYTISAHSQNKITYGGMQQMSISFSKEEVQPFFILTNGVRYKKYFVGVGWSYEGLFMYRDIRPMYGMQTYLDGRYYLGKHNRFFTILNVGLNTHIEKYKDWNVIQQRSTYNFKPGYYASTGFGVRAKIGREIYYSIDLSYNWKQTRYEYTYTNWLNKVATEYHNIQQTRIMLRLGFELF